MISDQASAWLEKRSISLEVALRLGIYSGRRERDGDDETRVVHDPGGDILVFPFVEDGQEVAAKYRGRPRTDGSKVFWQRKGGHKTFFNADVLDDPALAMDGNPLVVTEGEMDCLAVLTAGYPFAVSVPDGAPADRDHRGRPLPAVPQDGNDVDPLNDEKYAYVFNNWERLKRVKRVVLFTDGDGPGRRLQDELARRLGRVRCSFVTYPELGGRKPDANEVLLQHGARAVVDMVEGAKPFPIQGIYRLRDFPEVEEPPMVSTGWGRLDLPRREGMASIMLAPGFFMVVLGRPGAGKSTWTLQLAYNLASIHGWQIGVAAFENMPSPYVRNMLRTYHIGRPRTKWSAADRGDADAFLNDRFTFFYIDAKIDESEQSLEWLLQRAEEAVIRDGIRALIIDPWNEIEHVRRPAETETQYTARAIRALKRFAISFDVLVIVVIHPTKSGGLEDHMSLYDADGSAHWVNKPDIGIIVERDDGTSVIQCRKVRYSFLGAIGDTEFSFDPETEMFGQ